MIKTLDSLDKGWNIIDLTGAADDYPLQVGETATITYTSATSVPLRVATGGGVFSLTCIGNSPVGVSTESVLRPNNIDQSTNLQMQGFYFNSESSSPSSYNGSTSVNFRLGMGAVVLADLVLNTGISSKSAVYNTLTLETSTRRNNYLTVLWNDTVTDWTSLGTFIFSSSQSGKIVIRRIA